MANVKLIFSGTEESETQEHQLQCFANSNNNICININKEHEYYNSFICLDKSTAIKLHRELKKQISYLESEDENG